MEHLHDPKWEHMESCQEAHTELSALVTLNRILTKRSLELLSFILIIVTISVEVIGIFCLWVLL